MPATTVRFADPTRCPDCRYQLPPEPFACPSCRLPLRSTIATELLTTLATADDLLVRLRASAVAIPSQRPAEGPAVAPPAGSAGLPHYPARSTNGKASRGLRAASIPKILLGLGATCVLVAAVIFLAVAWSWLGVGGRTAVLVGLTAAAAITADLFRRRGLRIAAEALTTIALGLLTLDVVGADNAGWLGEVSLAGLVTGVGAVLALASIALVAPRERLLVPQLTAPAGLAILAAGVAGQTSHWQILCTVACLAFMLMWRLGQRLEATVLQWTAGTGAGAAWAFLGILALVDAADHPSARELWLGGHGWGLVGAALLALLPWALAPSAPILRQGCCAFAAGTITWVVALPGLDDGVTRAALVAVAATAVWAAVSAAAPPRWYVAPRIPLVGAALVPAAVAGLLAIDAVEAVVSVGAPYSASPAVRLHHAGELLAPAWLLPVCVAALVLAAALALPRRRWFWWAAAGVASATGLATLALLAAPLWTVLLGVTGAAIALGVDALRRTDARGGREAAAAGAMLVLASGLALPSEHLLTAELAALTAFATTVLVRGRFPHAAAAGGVILPLALAGLIWSVGEVAGVDGSLRGIPVLLLLGALMLLRPRIEVEFSAGLAALLTSAAAIPMASDGSVSLAIHLTVAGAIVTASALTHHSRRRLAWLGGLLLAAATWVRLADLGVEAPEPYTLPTAVVLVLVGLHRLRTSAEVSTMRALGPGLVLATVPSLLWVLADPVSVRAVILGIACLCLVLGGTWSRWNAPLVIGAVVGGLVVLRELAPYAAQTPQWVIIGAAGTLLIATGVTWEARVRNLRHATAHLGRLR